MYVHHGSTRCFILLFPFCSFTMGLSFIIYPSTSFNQHRLAFNRAHQPSKKCLFSFENGQKHISISEQWIIPIVDWEFLSPCIYFCSTCVIVLVSWWMSPHPLPLLWCGLSLSLIIAPSYPVSTFWCFLCALPDRISNKKSLSFWFLAKWEVPEWPLAFSLNYLGGRKTDWGGSMCKV